MLFRNNLLISYVLDDYLNRYKFEVEEDYSSTVSNNIYNNQINLYAVSRRNSDKISYNPQRNDVV